MRFFIVFLMSVLFFLPNNVYAQNQANQTDKGFNFPEKIGELNLVAKDVFEDPTMGYCVRYEDDSLLKVNIYVYNGGVHGIGNGTDTEPVKKEFESVLSVFSLMEQAGKYKDVKEIARGIKKLGRADFLWAKYNYSQLEGPGTVYLGTRISEVYFSGYADNYLKIRVTLNENDAESKEMIKEEFLQELGNFFSK